MRCIKCGTLLKDMGIYWEWQCECHLNTTNTYK